MNSRTAQTTTWSRRTGNDGLDSTIRRPRTHRSCPSRPALSTTCDQRRNPPHLLHLLIIPVSTNNWVLHYRHLLTSLVYTHFRFSIAVREAHRSVSAQPSPPTSQQQQPEHEQQQPDTSQPKKATECGQRKWRRRINTAAEPSRLCLSLAPRSATAGRRHHSE